MLQEISKEITQKWFSWTINLNKFKSMNISTPQERFDLMLEILKYSNSLFLRFIDRYELWNISAIPQLLANASTYKNNIKIIWSNLSEIISILSYEFIKLTNNNLDYKLIKPYIKWEVWFNELISEPKITNQANKFWSFKWLDWKEYTWEWLRDILNLKWPDIENILKWFSSDNEEVMNSIQWIYDIKNKDIIKEHYKNTRVAWISLIKYLIWNIEGDIKIIKLFNS